MLAAEVALAEGAVSNNSLRRLSALAGGATDSLGRHVGDDRWGGVVRKRDGLVVGCTSKQ